MMPEESFHQSIAPTPYHTAIRSCFTYNPPGPTITSYQKNAVRHFITGIKWSLELSPPTQLVIILNSTRVREWIVNVHDAGHFVPNNPELYGGDMAYHRVGEGEFALYGMEKTVAKAYVYTVHQ